MFIYALELIEGLHLWAIVCIMHGSSFYTTTVYMGNCVCENVVSEKPF